LLVPVAQALPNTFAAALDVSQSSTPAPATPALDQSILDQVVQSATLAVRNGEQEFRVQLKPDFLGAMEVRVSVDSGTVTVRLSVESAATRQLIDNNIGQLKQAFGTDHVRVEHVPSFASSDGQMSFNQGGQAGFWQGQNGSQAFNGPLPEAVPYTGEGDANAPAEATQNPTPSTQNPPAPAGLVDLQA
jgi:flagellar hook-length control protein FliK